MAEDRIAEGVKRVGVIDATLDLFEGRYPVPEGVVTCAYLIEDEQTALLDVAGARRQEEWMGRLERALGGRAVDYLVLSHVEPDQASVVATVAQRFPGAKLIAGEKTFALLDRLADGAIASPRRVVTEGDTLSVGTRMLHFLLAPMARWPEVVVSYEEKEKILFSADAFGRFGSADRRDPWEAEARRYYFGLFGRRGEAVQALLRKLSRLEIQGICPSHGPALEGKEASRALDLYGAWSGGKPQERGVLIAFAGFHGQTARAARAIADALIELGDRVSLVDLSMEHVSHAVAEAFRFDRMVLACATLDGELPPAMEGFLRALADREYSNRTVALIENGSWTPVAARKMREALEEMRQVTVTEMDVTIRGMMREEDRQEIEMLALELDNLV